MKTFCIFYLGLNLGGKVHVVAADGHRDSLDGTQIVGPACDQMTFFALL